VPQFAKDGGNGLPFNELHGIKVDTALAANAVNRDDVFMMQVGSCLRFIPKALELFRIQGRREW
jgi:hypothetical protein